MGTRALILHEQGAIWKKRDGYPTGLGKEILDCINRNFSYKDLYNHLAETDKSVLYILNNKDVEKMELDYEYVYRIVDFRVYVQGYLTYEEEFDILSGDVSKHHIIMDKINSPRRLIIEDGILCFIDIDGKLKEVTKYRI